MLDYAAWLERLRRFVASRRERLPPEMSGLCYVKAAPLLTADEIAWLQADLECPLPDSVAGFLTRATSGLRFAYAFLDPSGSTFEVEESLFCYAVEGDDSEEDDDSEDETASGPEAMILARNQCVEYALHSWLVEREWPIDRAFWRHALPLTSNEAGDGLAVWVHVSDDPAPPVVVLSHDDESTLVSPTFDDFLTTWEQCGYYWDDTFKGRGGFLDAASPAAVRYRASLERK